MAEQRKSKDQSADAIRARTLRAVEMKIARATDDQIADALDMSPNAVRGMINKALTQRAKEQDRPRAELVQQQIDLINRLIRARYTDAMATRPVINPRLFGSSDAEALARALEAANAVAGLALKSTDSIIKLLAREAKLLGLDAPIRADVRVSDAMLMEIEELMDQMDALDAQAAQQQEAKAKG